MSHRLFVAICPPEAVIDAMIDTMDGIENARWQDETQLHLTLRFVGEVDTPRANDVADALRSICLAPFEIAFRGVGHFERRHWPNAVWAGVEPSETLDILRKKIERAVVAAGLEPETRRFVPHVTLARLNHSCGPVGDWMARHGDFAAGPMMVDSFTLYESTLTASGPFYEPVVRYPLDRAQG